MRIKALTIFLTLTLVLALTIPLSQGNSSGRHNSGSSGCGCHGGSSGSISATENFPTEYDPPIQDTVLLLDFLVVLEAQAPVFHYKSTKELSLVQDQTCR